MLEQRGGVEGMRINALKFKFSLSIIPKINVISLVTKSNIPRAICAKSPGKIKIFLFGS